MELLIATIVFIVGLGILISGAEIFIHHSSQLGSKLGISDVVIGITLVALGTSIPEIFVSISSILNNPHTLYWFLLSSRVPKNLYSFFQLVLQIYLKVGALAQCSSE